MGIGFDPKKEYEELIDQVAKECGYTVYERHIRLKGVNTRITVKIDSASGIAHADCERFSRELARTLDDNGTLPNYMLEISSPGFNRKIRSPEEFVRFVNSPVKIIYENNGGKVAKGKLLAADEIGINVYVTEEKREMLLPYDAIKSANLDF
jgi:ribosome maturation factor RimP